MTHRSEGRRERLVEIQSLQPSAIGDWDALLQMGLGAFPGSRRVPLDVEEQESVRSGGSKDSARLAGKWSGS